MYYTVEKGLVIDLKESKIIIRNDNSILITHADDTSSIELKGGKITKYADQEIENTAVNRIKHSSEEVWMDGKTTNLGHSPLFSAVCAETNRKATLVGTTLKTKTHMFNVSMQSSFHDFYCCFMHVSFCHYRGSDHTVGAAAMAKPNLFPPRW